MLLLIEGQVGRGCGRDMDYSIPPADGGCLSLFASDFVGETHAEGTLPSAIFRGGRKCRELLFLVDLYDQHGRARRCR